MQTQSLSGALHMWIKLVSWGPLKLEHIYTKQTNSYFSQNTSQNHDKWTSLTAKKFATLLSISPPGGGGME